MENKLNKLTEQIEDILLNNPGTRNDDKLLYTELLKKFYSEYVDSGYIHINDMIYLPNYSTVDRIRRKFNEKGMYLPTIPEVKEKRKQLEKVYSNYFKK